MAAGKTNRKSSTGGNAADGCVWQLARNLVSGQLARRRSTWAAWRGVPVGAAHHPAGALRGTALRNISAYSEA